MSIIRVHHEAGKYAVIAKSPANDNRLQADTRGVMFYLLTKPDDWEIRNEDLQREFDFGEARLLRIFKELKSAGYMDRRRVNDPNNNGQWKWVTNIYDVPQRSHDEELFNEQTDEAIPEPLKQEQSEEPIEEDNHDAKTTMTEYLLSEELPLPESAKEWELLLHPAIINHLDIVKVFPGYSAMPYIIEQAGDVPNKVALIKTMALWKKVQHYSSKNIIGIYEWYQQICKDLNWKPTDRFNQRSHTKNGQHKNNNRNVQKKSGKYKHIQPYERNADDTAWAQEAGLT